MAKSKSSGVWDHVNIKSDSGEDISAIAPVVISASRSTDIPAFYGSLVFPGDCN
ncbi:MAG: hypothetical protein KAR13_12695 [Desulfobulbaceae bacterium]|nr:hypothetical protein [Desulfobulbaceae bacterium]